MSLPTRVLLPRLTSVLLVVIMGSIPLRTVNLSGAKVSSYENGRIRVSPPEGGPCSYTTGDDEAEELFATFEYPDGRRSKTLNPASWKIIHVLPRARNLYDNKNFDVLGPKERNSSKKNLYEQIGLKPYTRVHPTDYWDDVLDEERTSTDPDHKIRPQPAVEGAYVGYSIFMDGPVIVKPVRNSEMAPENRMQVENFNFKASEFKVEPHGSAQGKQTILHYLALMPGNLKALKKWVEGQDFVKVFEDGTYSFAQIRHMIKRAADSLAFGMPPSPVAKYKPLNNEDFEIAKQDPTLPLFSDEPEGPGNPLRSEVLCDASILRRGQEGISGFQYSVPYIKALRFPKELTELLLTLAKQFPNDLLTIETLYLALYAWYDITLAPHRKREASIPFSQNKVEGWKIPKVSLAECLIYYRHWLRWTEVYGFTEFPHFFRWVHRAVISDRTRTPLIVKETLIDEDRVKILMLQVTSSIPGINPGMRLLILPHMLPGTIMPRMINMEPYQTPTPEQLLLTGLPSVLLCGTPHYAPSDTPDDVTNFVPLCIPVTLANNCINSPLSPLLGERWDITTIRSAYEDTLTLICAPRLKVGPVWVWNKAQVARLHDNSVSQGPPPQMIDPTWNVFNAISDEYRSYFLHHARHAFQQLIEMGAVIVGENFNIHVNHQGHITAVECCPMTADRLRLPPPEMFSGAGGRERIEEEALRVDHSEENEPEGLSPVAMKIMEMLAAAPPMICLTWKQMLTAFTLAPSDLHIKSKIMGWLKLGLEEEEACWDKLETFQTALTMEKLANVDFDKILDTIRVLSGVEQAQEKESPIEAMKHSFMDFAHECTVLECMRSRLRNAHLGLPIPSGGNTTLTKFKSKWNSVIEELRPGRLEGKMEEYLRMLGGYLEPAEAPSYAEESIPEESAPDDQDPQDDSEFNGFESNSAEDEDSNDEDYENEDSENEDSENEESDDEESHDDDSQTSGANYPVSLASRDSRSSFTFREMIRPNIPGYYNDDTPANMTFIELFSPMNPPSAKRKRDDREDTDDEDI